MIQASGFMLMIFSSETNPEAPGSSCEPILFAPTASTSPPQPLWPWVKQQASLLLSQRFHEDVGLRRDGRGFLANRLQLLTIVIGKGFGLALAVKDFAQQVDAGGGIFRRGDLIVDKQHRNVQGAELVDDAALHQRWPGAQLGDHQIRLTGDDAFKIDVPFIAEAHVKDRGRLGPRRFQHLPGGNILLFRQIIPCHQPFKRIVPVQQGEGHNVATILQNNTLRLFGEGDLLSRQGP